MAGVVMAGFLGAAVAWAQGDYVTVRGEPVTTEVGAYAQVRPTALVPVRATSAGIVADCSVLPGTVVTTGQKLAALTGTEVDAARARTQAAVKSATARLAAARQNLALVRSQLASHLSTRLQAAQAASDLAAATGALATARADASALQQGFDVVAPVTGSIVTVDAANGQRVAVGDTVLVIQPSDDLWVSTTLYGSDAAAVRIGQDGTFKPDDGRAPVPLQIVSVAPAASGENGTFVGLRPAAGACPSWRGGEYGSVTIAGPARTLVTVPTQALVLDQGRWWVLVRTPQGNQRVAVVPGPSRGWNTVIESGLAPGAQVLVTNAYLEFHQDISSRYQPPD